MRDQYQEFHYNGFDVVENEQEILLTFDFEIPGLAIFRPKLSILRKKLPFRTVDNASLRNLAFQIGMVELVSYWKATMSPKIIVKCGKLDENQREWWRKLYYYGLGELMFRNGIDLSFDKFVTIVCSDDAPDLRAVAGPVERDGHLVMIGGGKDSIVTMETIGLDTARDYAMIINPKPTMIECAKLAGFNNDHIVEIKRTIDPNLIELNSRGFINGHTPFSALVAFVSYMVADLLGLKYAVVSNESSANESNVCDKKINHQYSKSFEFEEDFRRYADNYLKSGVEYLSFLRPLNELQIAKIFAKLKKYHQTFKSCNVGSKEKEWVWCGRCAKCLFAFTILAPYLYPSELVQVFGKDLFEDEELLPIFIELIGKGETKPFDCVGTFEEVNFAISLVIQKLSQNGQKLPRLLQYYVDHYELSDTKYDITRDFNDMNNLNAAQIVQLRKALDI